MKECLYFFLKGGGVHVECMEWMPTVNFIYHVAAGKSSMRSACGRIAGGVPGGVPILPTVDLHVAACMGVMLPIAAQCIKMPCAGV